MVVLWIKYCVVGQLVVSLSVENIASTFRTNTPTLAVGDRSVGMDYQATWVQIQKKYSSL
jgi:hypothetical protein